MTLKQAPLIDPLAERAVLEVRGLCIEARINGEFVALTQGVDLSIHKGRTLGLVGESGSGKTLTGQALIGLLPPNLRIRQGSVHYQGTELVGAPPDTLRKVRGAGIGIVFQEPRRSLDPSFSVGHQVAEAIRAHKQLSRKQAWSQAVAMLDRVHIAKAATRAHEYPHQFSGGMCQRVMLAVALASNPSVLIADEPTTALDVTVQAQMLRLINELQQSMDLGVLLITHDLGVVAEVCDEVAVMYAGQVVETGRVRDIFHHPRHPYTAALRDATPDATMDGHRLRTIAGQVPPPWEWPQGCRFASRCRHNTKRCYEEMPEPRSLGQGQVRCHHAEVIDLGGLHGAG